MIALAKNWIPIATGKLRESTVVKTAKNGSVEIATGENLPYARRQYNDNTPEAGSPEKALHHLRSSGTYGSLLDHGDSYQQAYNKARAGKIPGWRPSRAMWFKRVMQGKKTKKEIIQVFEKQVNKRIKKLLNG